MSYCKAVRAGLEDLHARHGLVQEVRGRGLMLGLRTERGPDVQKALFDRGLITNCTPGDVVRFLPPYIVTAAEIDRALEILDQTLGAL